MKRRKRFSGCSVEAHHGVLRLRFRWQGRRVSHATRYPDSAENRAKVDKLAGLLGAAIRAGQDPLLLLAKASAATPAPSSSGLTLQRYYDVWILDKVPPLVRRAQAGDYRRHLKKYVLPRLGSILLGELSARDILGLRAELLTRNLSLKYVKNILAGSLKAMLRDAREIDGVIGKDPFVGVRWPRIPVPPPDPFTLDEVRTILRYFDGKRFPCHAGPRTEGARVRPHPAYHAFLHLLFWTGMRPSEAAAQRWGDVDLEHGFVRVTRSRHLYDESAPKTSRAARTVELMPATIAVLRALQPLHADPDHHVFTNLEGHPIEPKAFLVTHWYRALRALGIRSRGLYCAKDTFISMALSKGVRIPWLEAHTGVAYETIRRHYGMWLGAEGGDQLARLADLAPSLAPKTGRRSEPRDVVEPSECRGGESNP